MKTFLRSLVSRSPARAAGGFTLIELLIAIAIMAMLLTLLGGGIRKSIDNAKKRQRTSEIDSLQSAIMTFWHDNGKPPCSTTKGTYSYEFKGKDNKTVFQRLANPSHSDNLMQKTYIDINGLRTADDEKHVRPMKTATEPIADPFGNFYTVVIDLESKNATVK